MKAEDREPLAQALFDAGYGVGEQVDIDRLKAKLAALGYEVRPIEPTRAGQACADCGQVWPNVDDHNDHPFRPIEQAAEAKTRVATVPAESESAVASAAVAPWYCPECGGVVLHDKPAVAPLDWQCGYLLGHVNAPGWAGPGPSPCALRAGHGHDHQPAYRLAVAPLDVEALVEGLHGQLCSMGQDHRPYDNGDLTCVAVATAAYADAIRKRGGA